MNRNMSMALAAALIAGVSGFGPAVASADKAAPPPIVAPQRNQKRQLMGSATSNWYPRRRGPGWTHAHVQRMARKARNVKRNRRAHR